MSEEIAIETSPNTQSAKVDVFKGRDPEVKVRTKKMMMWLIIFAVVMLFAGITSAMIVLYGKLAWVKIIPPTMLWVSNALVLLSSLTLYLALKSVKNGKQKEAFVLTGLTAVLGIGFMITQNAAWKQLSSIGMGYTITQNDEGLKSYRWNALDRLGGTYGVDYYIEYKGEKLNKVSGEYYSPSDTGMLNPKTREVTKTFNAAGAMLSVLIYVHIIHLVFGLIYLIVNTVRVYKGRINKENWISLYSGGMYWHFMGVLWLYLFAFIFYLA